MTKPKAKLVPKSKPNLLAFLRHLARDNRGVSAVEFALIAPLMLIFYGVTVEFCQAFMAQKRISNVGSAVGDIVTQSGTLSDNDFQSIVAIGPQIMQPFKAPADRLGIRVASITRISQNRYQLNWSKTSGNMTVPLDINLPEGVIAVNQTAIMTDAQYGYISLINFNFPGLMADLLPGTTTLKYKIYQLPRDTPTIACTGRC